MQYGGRAADLRAVVREANGARPTGYSGGQGRADQVRAAALRADLPELDGERPRLGDFAPAVVGTPHPGLVLPAVPGPGRAAAGRR